MWEVARRGKKEWVARAYYDYSFGRQTLKQLSAKYGVDISTLRRNFDRYQPLKKNVSISQEPVALTLDGTFFGRSGGWLVFRAESKNIYWEQIVNETISGTSSALLHLKEQGWSFSSFAIDGRKGVIRVINDLFPGVPIQMCVCHQKAIIRRYLSMKPKTDCGKAIKALADQLLSLDELAFKQKLFSLKDSFKDFLEERNQAGQFAHRTCRSAIRSLSSNLHYLFTFKRHPDLKIPTTTNSCDGSFAHWKNKVKIHRGLKNHRRSKMVHQLLKKS